VIVDPVFTVMRFGEKEKFLMTTVLGAVADPVVALFWSLETKFVTITAITATAGTITTSSHVGMGRSAASLLTTLPSASGSWVPWPPAAPWGFGSLCHHCGCGPACLHRQRPCTTRAARSFELPATHQSISVEPFRLAGIGGVGVAEGSIGSCLR
jgi:hypothetical protein